MRRLYEFIGEWCPFNEIFEGKWPFSLNLFMFLISKPYVSLLGNLWLGQRKPTASGRKT